MATSFRSLSRRPRVLIVDDNRHQRTLLTVVVDELGWTSRTVEDGAAAYAACQYDGPFDLIIMDYQMPRLNGCEATRKIRALGGWAAAAPILGATADYDVALRRQCLQAGMTDCVAKPLQPLAMGACCAGFSRRGNENCNARRADADRFSHRPNRWDREEVSLLVFAAGTGTGDVQEGPAQRPGPLILPRVRP